MYLFSVWIDYKTIFKISERKQAKIIIFSQILISLYNCVAKKGNNNNTLQALFSLILISAFLLQNLFAKSGGLDMVFPDVESILAT